MTNPVTGGFAKWCLLPAMLFLHASGMAAEKAETVEVLTASEGQLPLTERSGIRRNDSSPELPLSTISTDSKTFQQNPFSTIVDVAFVQEDSVGDAVAKLAKFLGYRLYSGGRSVDPDAMAVFQKPLPAVHREFVSASVLSILSALVGQGYTLVIDHKHRAVSADYSPGQRRYLRIKGLASQ